PARRSSDLIIVERLADDISSQLGLVRAPTVEFGVHPASRILPGGATLRRKTLHRVMNELIESWEEGAGVREFLLLTAQAHDAHQEALSTIRTNLATVTAVDVFAVDFGELVTPEQAKEPGGLLETSLLLHLEPGLVGAGGKTGPDRAPGTPELGQRLYSLILERIARYLTQ